MHYSTDVLLWTFHLEKPGRRTITNQALTEWDDSLFQNFEGAVVAACARKQIEASKRSKSMIVALALATRGELDERVAAAATFYKSAEEAEIS